MADERRNRAPRAGGVANVRSTSAEDSGSEGATSPRSWRIGDFLTGRYDPVARVWSSPSSPRQYPMTPVVSTLLESQANPRMSLLYSESGLGETGLQRQNIVLSSKLPPTIWYILAKSLGIKLSSSDRPIFATVLHILTLVAAFTFAIPGMWYTIYDIQSQFSKKTVLIGTVEIVIGFTWACMGVYAHKLAGRLFGNKNFVECVRVHSKTFLKISTSWLTIILGVMVVAVNCYEAAPIFYDNTCGTAEVDIIVCKVFFIGRVVYAFFTVLWNFIVAYVVFSVCRTHTIGIRRFMSELTLDARVYEAFCLEQYNIARSKGQTSMQDVNLEESWFLWDDTINDLDPADEGVTSRGVFLQSISGTFLRHRTSTRRRHASHASHKSSVSRSEERAHGNSVNSNSGQWKSSSLPTQPEVYDGQDSADSHPQDGGQVDSAEFPATPTVNTAGSVNGDPFDEAEDAKDEEDGDSQSPQQEIAPAVLTNDDLLFSYWKFMRRLCVTSRFLQRWLASWITFVVIWDSYFIVYWTSHDAKLIAILQFITPLLLLLLLCSAYAEVNAEGQRLLQTICPLEERLAVIFYFNQNPLSVKVFSFTVTYNAIMTVILGFSVAFASRMILDEITKT